MKEQNTKTNPLKIRSETLLIMYLVFGILKVEIVCICNKTVCKDDSFMLKNSHIIEKNTEVQILELGMRNK